MSRKNYKEVIAEIKKKFYVYELIDPDTLITFYVGKGTNRRFMDHLYNCNIQNNLKKEQIKDIINRGKVPVVKIVHQTDSETEAYIFENKLIKTYGMRMIHKNGILTNIKMQSIPPVIRNFKNRVLTEIGKQKLSISGKKFTGENNPFFGEHHSDVTKDKIRKALTGKKLSEETKQKMSISRKNQRAWNKGISPSEETKQKIKRNASMHRCNRYEITLPNGQKILTINRRKFCKENNLNYNTVNDYTRRGIPYKNYFFKLITDESSASLSTL